MFTKYIYLKQKRIFNIQKSAIAVSLVLYPGIFFNFQLFIFCIFMAIRILGFYFPANELCTVVLPFSVDYVPKLYFIFYAFLM